MLNLFFITLGAKISLSAYLDTTDITAYDLVTIKEGCVVLSGAGVRGHSIEGLFVMFFLGLEFG